ncbi:MAG: hypothetical protein AOA65_2045 [Candidatus Bathyarchaeota archaeon BA1]|nr:MAG: hypothetical protein AOA65_2045 [Candidatus Bathyarchaeota archaeon BA1]
MMEVGIMPEALQIPLEEFKDWLEQETASIVKPLRDKGLGLLKDVESKLKDFRDTCERLFKDGEREMLKGGPKTYRSAKAMNRFARGVLEMTENVDFPDKILHESLQMLCGDLEKTLESAESERRAWFPYIEPYFIIDRRRFDAALRRCSEALKELHTFSSKEYEKARAVEEAFPMIDRIFQLLNESKGVEMYRERMDLEGNLLEKKIIEDQQKIMLIQSKDEVRGLVQANRRIEELEGKVKHDLRYLQKPFYKFQSLARSADVHLPFDEARKLGEYLSSPFEALATEQEGYPLLKRVLRKLDDAIVRGKLKLKSSRLRGAQEQIHSILHEDALIPIHRSCKEAFSQRQQLLLSEAMAAFQNELAQLQKGLRDLQKQRELIDSRIAVLDGEHREISEKIKNQKGGLEKILLGLTGKNVQVIL